MVNHLEHSSASRNKPNILQREYTASAYLYLRRIGVCRAKFSQIKRVMGLSWRTKASYSFNYEYTNTMDPVSTFFIAIQVTTLQ